MEGTGMHHEHNERPGRAAVPTGIPLPIPNESAIQSEITAPGGGPPEKPEVIAQQALEISAHIAGLTPEEQESTVVAMASRYAYDSPKQLTLVADAVDTDHPLFMQAYDRVLGLPKTHYERPLLLAGISQRPDLDLIRQGRAWDEAIASSKAIGMTERWGERAHMLEYALEGQTNTDRVDDALVIGIADENYHILRSAARQYIQIARANIGTDEPVVEVALDGHHEAVEKLIAIGAPALTIAEARVHLTSYLADPRIETNRVDVWMSVKNLPPHIQTIGHVALATMSEAYPATWSLVDKELQKHWDALTPRMKTDIITALSSNGQFERAVNQALNFTSAERGGIYMNTIGRRVLLSTIRAYAASDPEGAQQSIERAKTQLEQQLATLKNKQVHLQPGTASAMRCTVGRSHTEQSLNAIAALHIILQIPGDEQAARDAIAAFSPRGHFADIGMAEFYNTVSAAYAQAGNIPEAVRLASLIGEERPEADLRCEALARVARMLRAQRTGDAQPTP